VLYLLLLASEGEEDLADVHSGSLTKRLTEGTSHAGLEPIGSGA